MYETWDISPHKAPSPSTSAEIVLDSRIRHELAPGASSRARCPQSPAFRSADCAVLGHRRRQLTPIEIEKSSIGFLYGATGTTIDISDDVKLL
jgi:hypothetical protein